MFDSYADKSCENAMGKTAENKKPGNLTTWAKHFVYFIWSSKEK